VKIKTLGLALIATTFMASTALAQTGTMQPIPNPPEKAKPVHHKKKKPAAKAEAAAPATAATPSTAATPAKPATPPKK